ncbi:MAG: aldo/keto reductase [Patescibacteria group bacterium]|nr:aldo/keto reductase [Patescibacteria group bacterium]
MEIPTKKLNPKTEIPMLGLGTWKLRKDRGKRAVEAALQLGYKHVDTADAYNNHQVISDVINKSSIKREQLFITSKIWRTDLEKTAVVKAGNRTLKELNTDYLDLLLIHWPNSTIPIEETLNGMQTLKVQRKVRAIGVSNFTISHLKEALKTGIKITNNQVEYHPSFTQQELQTFCEEHNIIITAYSPLGQGQDLRIQVIQDLAKKYKQTPAQIITNWHIQEGRVVIPRSAEPDHLRENIESLNFELERKDIEKINQIPRGRRLIAPPFHEFFE